MPGFLSRNAEIFRQDIYDESKQSYGASKITRKLCQNGAIISEHTVGKYMKKMGIRAQWVKLWTITTEGSDFSSELQNILNEQFTPDRSNAVRCSDITYIWMTDGFDDFMDLLFVRLWHGRSVRL